jgi:hypothetical protein
VRERSRARFEAITLGQLAQQVAPDETRAAGHQARHPVTLVSSRQNWR